MGCCGLVCLFPEAWAALAPTLLGSGDLWSFYDRSKGYEKMVAYSSIGHMGYVISCRRHAFEPLASVFQMISHGLISLLFLGVVYQKTVAAI